MYYRKYRPQKFSEISKPNDVALALSNQLKSGKTVHAYLFVGPRGTGKTTTARILAKALNCPNLIEGDPCDNCASCVSIKNGSFVDLIEIDAASNRGIDDIRELKEKINLAPSASTKKIYIVDEVHMLTQEAFNALLKTLEEPPAHVTFILCTTEFQKVPETIKSRCQVFKFKRATIKQITERLKTIAKSESAKISDSEINLIAQSSQGGFRDADTLLQQVIEGEIDAKSLFNNGGKDSLCEYINYILNGDSRSAIDFINKLYEDGVDLFTWIGELLKYLRTILVFKSGSEIFFDDLSDESLADVQKFMKSIELPRLLSFIDLVSKAQTDTKNSFIVQLPIELASVKMCSYERPDDTIRVQEIPHTPSSPVTVVDVPVIKSKPETKQEVVKEKSTENALSALTYEECKKNWRNLIKDVSLINNSVSALLKAGELVSVEGTKVVLEVPFDFHKERIESLRNREIIETALMRTYNLKLSILCDVKKKVKEKKPTDEKITGTLTDLNIMVPTQSQVPALQDADAILDVFDGALPL